MTRLFLRGPFSSNAIYKDIRPILEDYSINSLYYIIVYN